MKKILAIAAVAALTAGVSAYAANPFSDVTPDDWAYQAVVDLSEQGVVIGYPDGTFRGERNITRFEMAQIIARMLANEDQMNAEQRAMLDKLAGEYADELSNLGVRVSNLEKKVGNLSFSGNSRVRFLQYYGNNGKAEDKWDGRMQVSIKGQVNDSTYAYGRLRYDMNLKGNDKRDAYMKALYVHHDFNGKAGLTLGRMDLFLGQTGLQYDDTFDGAMATIGSKKLAADIGYGHFTGGNLGTATEKEDKGAAIARVYGKSGRLAYDVEYIQGEDKYDARIWGAGLTAGVTDDIDIFGDYYQNTDYKGDPQTWTAGLAFGHYSMKKPGTFRIAGQYISAEKGSFLNDTTYTASAANLAVDNDKINRSRFWLASGDLVLMKNVRLHGEYAFDVKTKGEDKTDYDDLATVSLNYVF
ncbi:S-layer homology domain-containing protein [Dialister hominis]|jgi:hypothetical protein|nr:S-layer homology domain-containing protein [uncultured Dialister sp.]